MELSDIQVLTKEMIEALNRDGWTVDLLALASVRALTGYKGIGNATAAKIISQAQDRVNEHGLYESRQQQDEAIRLAHLSGQPQGGDYNPVYPESSPAFPVEWLSGEVEPPPMALRIRRNFEGARLAYENKESEKA